MSAPVGWNFHHVELSGGTPTLDAAPDGRGAYVVFWWRGVPIGDWYFSPDALPMRATELAELAARLVTDAVGVRLFGARFSRGMPPGVADDEVAPPLDVAALAALDHPLARVDRALDDELHGSDAASESVSVVVCTRDRATSLARCLRALQALAPPPDEIVVVDNASATGATQAAAEAVPGVRYVHEPRPGLDIARNTGARAASGDLVAYVDDDVEVHPGWLAGLRRGFHSPEIVAVTGLVLPAELETLAQVAFETEWTFNKGFAPKTFGPAFFKATVGRGVPVWEIGAGANMAFRREVFGLVGGFDERLDVGAAGCSGDSEMWYRILAEGGRCRYEPSAVVFHTHRRELDALDRQVFAYMRGHAAALLIQYEKYHHWGDLRRLSLALPRYYLHLLRRRLRRGRDLRTRTLLPEVRGYLSGVLFYLRNRQSARGTVERPESPLIPSEADAR